MPRPTSPYVAATLRNLKIQNNRRTIAAILVTLLTTFTILVGSESLQSCSS